MHEERGYSGAVIALGCMLGGAALGAGLVLLLAPKSGEQTRAGLRDLAVDMREHARDLSKDLRDRAGEVVERGRQAYDTKRTMVSAAVQAGKEAVQRERTRLAAR